MLILTLAILFFSIVCHEVAHAWVADKFGDSTAKLAGRITFNPLAHVDLVGTLLLPAMCLLMGGVIVGWAKPVPVNFEVLRPRRLGIACVALAGIAANLLIAALGTATFWALFQTGCCESQIAGTAIFMVVYLNILLAIFNLIPIPPLDGSRILMLALPQTWAYKVERCAILLFPLVFILLILLLVYLPILQVVFKIALFAVGG